MPACRRKIAAAQRSDLEAVAGELQVVAGDHDVVGEEELGGVVRACHVELFALDDGLGGGLGGAPAGQCEQVRPQENRADKTAQENHWRMLLSSSWKVTRTAWWMETLFSA